MYEHNKILQQVQTGHNTVRILKTVYFFCFCVIQCMLCVKIFNVRPYRYMGPVTQGEALGYLLPLQERFPGITSHLELQMCDGTDPSPFIWPRYPLIFYTVVTFLISSHHSIYSWPSNFNMTTDFFLSCNPTLFESHISPICPCRDNPWCLKNDDVSSDLFVPWEWAFLLFDNSWHLCFHIRFKIWPIW